MREKARLGGEEMAHALSRDWLGNGSLCGPVSLRVRRFRRAWPQGPCRQNVCVQATLRATANAESPRRLLPSPHPTPPPPHPIPPHTPRNTDGERVDDGRYQWFAKDISSFIPAARQFTDAVRTFAYGTDASFYRLTPKLVVKVRGRGRPAPVDRAIGRADGAGMGRSGEMAGGREAEDAYRAEVREGSPGGAHLFLPSGMRGPRARRQCSAGIAPRGHPGPSLPLPLAPDPTALAFSPLCARAPPLPL